jgi:hypothetical protein
MKSVDSRMLYSLWFEKKKSVKFKASMFVFLVVGSSIVSILRIFTFKSKESPTAAKE